MNDIKVYSATEVRKNWSDIIDLVQEKPIKVTRNRKNTFSVLSISLLEMLLEDYHLDLKLEKEDDIYIGEFEDFDLLASEATKEETINDLKEQLIEYSKSFIEELSYYSSDKERMAKLPHLLKVYIFPEKLDEFINFRQ